VRQIGQMARNAADVNNDGKLDWKDAFEAVRRTTRFAVPGLGLTRALNLPSLLRR
jgi:hypothetical protein